MLVKLLPQVWGDPLLKAPYSAEAFQSASLPCLFLVWLFQWGGEETTPSLKNLTLRFIWFWSCPYYAQFPKMNSLFAAAASPVKRLLMSSPIIEPHAHSCDHVGGCFPVTPTCCVLWFLAGQSQPQLQVWFEEMTRFMNGSNRIASH